MSLRTFTAIQPTCDAEGCKFVMNGDYEQWYEEGDVQQAADDWDAYDGYVSADRSIWLCQQHAILRETDTAPGPVHVYPPIRECITAGHRTDGTRCLYGFCPRCGLHLDDDARCPGGCELETTDA